MRIKGLYARAHLQTENYFNAGIYLNRWVKAHTEMIVDMMQNTNIQVSVIILTYNEALNIEECLQSIYCWAKDIFIVDSYSTDLTITVARNYTDKIVQNPWISFAKQREWALDNLDIRTNWILFLDADERLMSDLRKEISEATHQDKIKGFYIRRRFIFQDTWLKHGGYYPLPELRLFKRDCVRFVDEGGGARERFLVEGDTKTLNFDALHIYDEGVGEWSLKHLKLARLEAKAELEKNSPLQPIEERFCSKMWLRNNVWKHLPRTIRPFMLFFYRYILRLGFLDGRAGLIYCVLHDLWYPLLIDVLFSEGRIHGVKTENVKQLNKNRRNYQY